MFRKKLSPIPGSGYVLEVNITHKTNDWLDRSIDDMKAGLLKWEKTTFNSDFKDHVITFTTTSYFEEPWLVRRQRFIIFLTDILSFGIRPWLFVRRVRKLLKELPNTPDGEVSGTFLKNRVTIKQYKL